jgi:hypothetical protein
MLLLALRNTTLWSLVFDDSFYYFHIARHIASGHGSTFDGFHSTNGYHPLWMGVCVVLFTLGLDRDAAPLAALLVQVLLFGVSWVIVGSALARVCQAHTHRADAVLRRALVAALCAVALMHPLVKVWVNGLESTVALLFQAALLRLAVGHDLLAPGRTTARIGAGLLIVGAFLSRTDGALLLPAIALWALPSLLRRRLATARALVEWLLLPSLVVVGFMVANRAVFGSAIQVSGLLKLAPLGLARVVGAVVLFAAFWGLLAVLPRATFPRTADFHRRTGFFGQFAAMICAYYAVLGLFPRLWYFGPALLLATAAGICVLLDLMARAADERPGATPAAAARPVAIIFGIVTIAAVGQGAWETMAAPSAAPMWANRDAGRYVATHLPRDAVLASWDAGVVGYYAMRPVVNLDGVANSVEYLRALGRGTTPQLLARVPISWVVNHSDSANGERSLRAQARALLGPRAEGMRLTKTWRFSVFGGVNRSVPTANDMQVYLFELARAPTGTSTSRAASTRSTRRGPQDQ